MFHRLVDFFHKQIPFVASFQKKVLVGFIIGAVLAFVILFLEPFNTNEYEANHRTLLLLGFGAVWFLVYLVYSSLENIWYAKTNKVWKVADEVISLLVFLLISGTVIYLYNAKIINGLDYSITAHGQYYKNIVSVFIPIFSPLLFYLRNQWGERLVPICSSAAVITGANKNEVLQLEKKDLLYIKAVQNYIEIYFLDSDKNSATKTFRQTLTGAQQQLPFLKKCHRSFLVNEQQIKAVQGNSQKAKIIFEHSQEEIPLSKTYYKKF
ncbi:LytTR family DNA-binding domain-containing protein [Mesonia sp. K7]|uniref:LytTR family DNA-binding domain-containing protein n=1 Tax=Mesonia sp. K7 TaxID=2218606 RepID=UPI000DA8105F|nr:LytTR family DNA-binding domain-containing protein [Mesonia sp. K7]PZD77113.1 hypothetical protein DNG35_09720 [Mesonia sp. K7]